MITIKVDKAAAVAALTRLNPAQVRSRLTQAIRLTLREGKEELKARITERYTAKNPMSLGQVSVRAAGLKGTMKVGGRRNLLKKFIINPSTRINPQPPGGVHAIVVKGQGGAIRRAFIARGGKVYERVGKARFPIRHHSTISLSGMAKAVGDKVENKMARILQRRIEEALSAL